MLDRLFQFSKRQTTAKTEIIAGLTTFLTMAYIIFAHPNILAPTGMDKHALIAVTCLISAAATIVTGLLANAPIAMAPGLGLNAFFAYLVSSGKMDWQTALGAVFLSGMFFLLLTLLGLRKKLVEAIPQSLVAAIAVGIGLFITFVGLVNLGIIVSDPHTLLRAEPLKSTVLIGLFGLLVMVFFQIKHIKGSLLVGILASTVLAAVFRKIQMPSELFSLHLNLKTIALRLNILGALKSSYFASIFTLMFIDMFDSIGTLVACCHQAGMVDRQNRIEKLDRLLAIDAAATMTGALLGTSTTTAFMESAAGIEQGGRTGLTSLVTGLLFLFALLFVPLVRVVPAYATAPALIMVGLFMIKEVRRIDFTDIEQAFPAFIIIVMIALSYSISTGLAFGFLSYTAIKIVAGKIRQIKFAMWVITILSLLFLLIDRLPELFGRLGHLL